MSVETKKASSSIRKLTTLSRILTFAQKKVSSRDGHVTPEKVESVIKQIDSLSLDDIKREFLDLVKDHVSVQYTVTGIINGRTKTIRVKSVVGSDMTVGEVADTYHLNSVLKTEDGKVLTRTTVITPEFKPYRFYAVPSEGHQWHLRPYRIKVANVPRRVIISPDDTVATLLEKNRLSSLSVDGAVLELTTNVYTYISAHPGSAFSGVVSPPEELKEVVIEPSV